MLISFDVLGIPAPQGSKSAFVRRGADGKPRAVLVEGSSASGRRAVAAWRDAVATVVAGLGGRVLDEPVAVRIDFFLPLPQGDRYRTRHASTPDVDKLVRSTLDALVMGGLLVDDSRVCELQVVKRYARNRPPGAHVGVVPLGEAEAADREALKAEARSRR